MMVQLYSFRLSMWLWSPPPLCAFQVLGMYMAAMAGAMRRGLGRLILVLPAVRCSLAARGSGGQNALCAWDLHPTLSPVLPRPCCLVRASSSGVREDVHSVAVPVSNLTCLCIIDVLMLTFIPIKLNVF